MEYPKIQTESFYKFLTLAGAFLIIISNTYFFNKRYETMIENAKFIKDLKILNEKKKEFNEKLNEENNFLGKIASILQKINEKQNAINKITHIKEPHKKVQESEKISNEIKELNKELEIEGMIRKLENKPAGINKFEFETKMKIEEIESEYKKKLINYKISEFAFWNMIRYPSQILGFLLLVWGCIKWIKIQNIQDEFLNYQLQIIKKENPYLIEEKKKTDGKKKKIISRIEKNGKQ